MKTYLPFIILISFVVFPSGIKSQGYIPFPEPGLMQGAWYSGNVYHSPPDHSVSFKYTGDTVYNSYTYSRLCDQDWVINTSCVNTYPAYTRFDNGKIYWRSALHPSAGESLMYDFSLNVGDSFTVYRGYSAIKRAVSEKTRVTTADGIQRWRIKFNTSNPSDSVVWLEGLGDIAMGFFASGDWEGGWSQFICQYTAQGFMYGNANALVSCDSLFASSITNIVYVNNQPVQILPNPFSNQLTFTLENYEPTTIILYDFLSRQILQQTFTNSTTINTAQLANGVYFYELRNDKGVIKKGKVVKQ